MKTSSKNSHLPEKSSGPKEVPAKNAQHTPLLSEIAYKVDGDFVTLTMRRDSPHFALCVAAPDLLAACETIAGELQAWNSTGDSRPASWAESRISRLRAAIAKAQP